MAACDALSWHLQFLGDSHGYCVCWSQGSLQKPISLRTIVLNKGGTVRSCVEQHYFTL